MPVVPCGDNQVCLSVAQVKDLVIWMASMKEVGQSLEACSLVDEIP